MLEFSLFFFLPFFLWQVNAKIRLLKIWKRHLKMCVCIDATFITSCLGGINSSARNLHWLTCRESLGASLVNFICLFIIGLKRNIVLKINRGVVSISKTILNLFQKTPIHNSPPPPLSIQIKTLIIEVELGDLFIVIFIIYSTLGTFNFQKKKKDFMGIQIFIFYNTFLFRDRTKDNYLTYFDFLFIYINKTIYIIKGKKPLTTQKVYKKI